MYVLYKNPVRNCNYSSVVKNILNCAGMMHGIAQLALFSKRGAMVGGLGDGRESFMLMSVYRPLARKKADYNHPGDNDIALVPFHGSTMQRPSPQKYVKGSVLRHCSVTMSL